MDGRTNTMEMDEIDKQLAELQAKKNKILKEKEEYELSKPVVIVVIDFDKGFYKIRANQERKDLDHKAHGRYSKEDNTIAIADNNWVKYNEIIGSAKNVTIFIPAKIEFKVKEWANRPDVTISLEEKHFVITLREHYNVSTIGISSKIRHRSELVFTISKLECEALAAWLIGVREYKKAYLTPEAEQFLTNEVERISKLDKLAQSRDTELTVDLNGLVLKDFQKVGIVFAKETKGRCLIGDEMGLGKTIQALGYAKLHNLRTLIIVPASLTENWIREIKERCQVSPRWYKGTIPDNGDITDMLTDKSKQFSLISYNSVGTYAADKDKYGREIDAKFPWVDLINLAKFDLIVTDEVHKIKNVDSGRSKGTRKIVLNGVTQSIGLSGTPVLNRPMELWPFFSWIAPDRIPNQADFAYRYTDGRNGVRNVEDLKQILKPLMIRRLKKDVIAELPAIINEYSYTELTDRQRRIYDKILEGIYFTLDGVGNMTNEQQFMINVLAKLGRLKQFCAALKMQGVADYATELYDENEGTEHRKVIIFSQYRNTCRGIHRRLGAESITFDGTVPPEERMKIVDQFHSDDKIHFLTCTTMAASEGLNITAAGHVIFNDLLWTPAQHDQAIGRAYGRLSDCHGVVAHWHIIKNTIEDWIMDLLKEKTQTIEATVDGVNSARSQSSIVMEIIKRLKKGR